ncbi:MAG: tripartite tricarboxylate transporter substrate binding protein [Pigmentiphaga sp.]|nr:tripartite tricarboxylate transporter substrate binding protein [Pigmentiphaga sp.]
MKTKLACAALATLSTAPAFASADTWPTKPVHIIVPFAPGGGVDILTRAVMAELGKRWNQPVVIENRGGAGSLIGAGAVAKAPADGYTLLATISQTVVNNRFLYKSLPYDPDKSFEPITMMVNSDQMIVANANFEGNSLKDIIEAAKKKGSRLSYGSFGTGSAPHLLFESLNEKEGLDILHVPYKGVTPMLTAIAAGEVMFGTGSVAVATPLMDAGKIKPITVAGAERIKQLKDVSTSTEQGYPYLQASLWYGLFAPAGTPEAIVNKIQSAVDSVLSDPAFVEQHVTAKGLDVISSKPADFRKFIQEDVTRTAEQIKAAGVTPE